MKISDERRNPDRPPRGIACSGCHGKGNPGQADIRSSGIKKNGRVIRVHVWAPDIAASEHCQGVPDRRKPKREHVVRGPDRRTAASVVAAPALLCEFCHGTGRAPNSQFSCHHCDKRMEG